MVHLSIHSHMHSLHVIHFTSFIYPPSYLLSHSKLVLSSITFLLLLVVHSLIRSSVQPSSSSSLSLPKSVHPSMFPFTVYWYLVEDMVITPVVPFHVPCVSAWAPPWLSLAVFHPFSIDYFFRMFIKPEDSYRPFSSQLFTVSTITLWTWTYYPDLVYCLFVIDLIQVGLHDVDCLAKHSVNWVGACQAGSPLDREA